MPRKLKKPEMLKIMGGQRPPVAEGEARDVYYRTLLSRYRRMYGEREHNVLFLLAGCAPRCLATWLRELAAQNTRDVAEGRA